MPKNAFLRITILCVLFGTDVFTIEKALFSRYGSETDILFCAVSAALSLFLLMAMFVVIDNAIAD